MAFVSDYEFAPEVTGLLRAAKSAIAKHHPEVRGAQITLDDVKTYGAPIRTSVLTEPQDKPDA